MKLLREDLAKVQNLTANQVDVEKNRDNKIE
jgi:hypothetical protein